ncbi:uncharacterized protein LOC133031191 [Cannabis sativa]|uniref:uncharacterized protein LOC133031191 n=1 Tax=Cannabis sativa TaxID=3483 RepID=UPI0029CA3546|nr:uncharacterized protein LOC133031191 [Cannabis sativa]
MNQREVFWRQRSKRLWLQEGDSNSKYFHAKTTSRKKHNTITRLMNDVGNWVTWEDELPNVMIDYFTNLFTSNVADYSTVVEEITPSITMDQNMSLLRPVLEEEVRSALFNMHLDKSLGPDGMTPSFFQKYWEIVNSDVVNQVCQFFANGSIPDGLNDTNIVLIPKKKQPTSMGDLRPISLCNVLYKIVSKVLASRLKEVLPQIISSNQLAFISNRLITDNIMIAFEVMEYLKRKRKGKEGFMALKLDLSKAYDRVEWGFLRAMMSKMGFDLRFIDLVIATISSVSYVYCRANDREVSNILHLLQLFEIASAQQVNFSKSSVFFSTNVPNATRDRLCGILRMRHADEHSTYLGLPCVMGRNKDAILGFLKDKMQKRIQSWEGRFLSTAGREVLLKTVAQALPSFAMSVFLLPLKTCSHLESLMSKYWWSSSSRKGWRLLLYQDSLVGRIYKARYFPNCSFLEVELGGNPSFIWRNVLESQKLLIDGARRRIGSGSYTEVLNTP